MMPLPLMDPDVPSLGNNGAAKAQPRMLAPGYYSQECNAHKPCDPGKFKIVGVTFSCPSR